MTNLLSKIFRDKHDAWVAINLAVRFSTRMITIGLLVHYLSVSEVASWYIFMAIFGLVSLAEAGMGRVVTRQVADRFGATIDCITKKKDLLFLITIFRYYRILILVICLFASFIGIWWLKGHTQEDTVPWLIVSWLIFVAANGINLYSALHAAVLNGLGRVSTSQVNETIASLSNLLVFLLVAYFSSSLLAPTLALLVSSLVALFRNHISLISVLPLSQHKHVQRHLNYNKALFARVTPELGKYFMMLLAFHLLTSAFVLMLSHYEGASVVASYGLTMQLITLVLTFSNIWMTSSFPKMAAQKEKTNKQELKRIFFSICTRGLSVLLLGMLVILFLGDFSLNLIESKVALLNNDILVVMILVISVEYFIFTLLGQLLVSQSMMNFTYYSVIGAGVICLSGLVVLDLGFGIIGLYLERFIWFGLIIAIPIFKGAKKILGSVKEKPSSHAIT